jgi:hypothetical protein
MGRILKSKKPPEMLVMRPTRSELVITSREDVMMKTLVNVLVGSMVALLAVSGCALAQTPSDAEARLKEKNITLPPASTFNYVNAVQVGNLLFLAGICHTSGP